MKSLVCLRGYLTAPNEMTEINGKENGEESLTVVPLHRRPELTKQCCDLVNEEWPRSETARMMSLKSSCDKMPTCLVLVNGERKVIGHCKLTPIPSIPDSCFVESVVISKQLRGKGLGKFLMKASEEYCRSALNLKTVHLSTIDQIPFYTKLGYETCQPVCIYGSFPLSKPFTPPLKVSAKTNGSVPPPPPLPLNKSAPNKLTKVYMVKSI